MRGASTTLLCLPKATVLSIVAFEFVFDGRAPADTAPATVEGDAREAKTPLLDLD